MPVSTCPTAPARSRPAHQEQILRPRPQIFCGWRAPSAVGDSKTFFREATIPERGDDRRPPRAAVEREEPERRGQLGDRISSVGRTRRRQVYGSVGRTRRRQVYSSIRITRRRQVYSCVRITRRRQVYSSVRITRRRQVYSSVRITRRRQVYSSVRITRR